MDNSQTLELQIKSKAQEAKTSVDSLVKSLTSVENVLTNIYLEIGSIKKKVDSNINKATTSTTKNINQLKQTTDKATNSAGELGKTLKTAFTFAGVKRATGQLLGWINEGIDYTEQLNLFNVVFDNTEKNGKQMFSELGKSALQFQYKMNEAFGTNKTQTLYMQGIFESMGETVGIKDKYSSIMSETMTKLTYDLASLYNKTEKTTAEAIRAGVYAGQTKPLRSYGIDVTQSSLQPIVKELGITDENGDIKSVKNMSQAEKEILRYLATLKQAKIAMGDLANTVESPSNQLKIFRQQLVEAKVALSSLFIGTFSKILPYANAILMVIKEVSKAIADMFGIELKDYNSGIASQEGIYDGIADSADDASSAVKELKRQTLGFDEIHNINENKDSGSNSGGTSGGIDQRLLDAIQGYDNGMDKVRMKASEIRDKIMEWLGFTKEIDPLTGEVSFKFKGIKTLLKNVLKSWKDTSTVTKIIMGLGLVAGLTNTYKIGKKIYNLLGGSGITKVLKSLTSPMKTLYDSLNDINFANKTLTQGISEGISSWSSSLTMIDKFKVGLTGIIGLSLGMDGIKSAMHSVSEEGWNLGNSLQTVISSLSGIASGAYIGSIFGPWGTVIGGATGAVLELIGAIQGYQRDSDKALSSAKKRREEAEKYISSVKEEKQAIEDSMVSSLTLTTYHEQLVAELKSIVDENGNVKKGYKDRAEFILNELSNAYGVEYSLINGQIKDYGNLVNKIKELIDTKKAEIVLNANEKTYSDAIQNRATAWKNANDALKIYNSSQEEVNKKTKEIEELEKQKNKAMAEGGYLNIKYAQGLSYEIQNQKKELSKLTTAADENKATYEKLNSVYVEYSEDIIKYENLSTDIMTGNSEKIADAVKQYTDVVKTENGNIKLSEYEKLNYYKQNGDTMLQYLKKQGTEVTDEMRNQAYSQYNELVNNLINQSTTVENLSPDIISAWKKLGETSNEDFQTALKKVDPSVKESILSQVGTIGSEAGKKLGNSLSEAFSFTTSGMKVTTYSDGTIKVTKKALGGIYSNGSWKDIPQYANGGAPSHGSLVFAGENGPEILGNANGKTEILNKSQIASSIYSAVYSAMSQFSGGGVAEINVHADKGTIVETAVNGIQQHINQTGTLPFTIPLN